MPAGFLPCGPGSCDPRDHHRFHATIASAVFAQQPQHSFTEDPRQLHGLTTAMPPTGNTWTGETVIGGKPPVPAFNIGQQLPALPLRYVSLPADDHRHHHHQLQLQQLQLQQLQQHLQQQLVFGPPHVAQPPSLGTRGLNHNEHNRLALQELSLAPPFLLAQTRSQLSESSLASVATSISGPPSPADWYDPPASVSPPPSPPTSFDPAATSAVAAVFACSRRGSRSLLRPQPDQSVQPLPTLPYSQSALKTSAVLGFSNLSSSPTDIGPFSALPTTSARPSSFTLRGDPASLLPPLKQPQQQLPLWQPPLSAASLLTQVASAPTLTRPGLHQHFVSQSLPTPPPPPPPPPHHVKHKTEMCKLWEETRSCRYGDRCQFAHSPEELRPVARHPKWK
ncbi:mRNA decay activator protein zfp36, partial [Cladochytrium tenue]